MAGGSGRNALWLARQGLEVTLVDISREALHLARERSRVEGLRLRTLCLDLEREPLPEGPWDLVVCTYFLHRPLFQVFPQVLTPGGILAFCQPTRTHATRYPRPGPRYLLEDGELPGLVGGLEILMYREGWFAGDHVARLVARRPHEGGSNSAGPAADPPTGVRAVTARGKRMLFSRWMCQRRSFSRASRPAYRAR